jgi:hypothetical protein
MGGGGAAGDGTRSLDQTPTWAVAAVCAVIVAFSIILEGILHHLGKVPHLMSPLPPSDIFDFLLRLVPFLECSARLPPIIPSPLRRLVLALIADSFHGCRGLLLPVAHQAEEDGAVRGSREGQIRYSNV